MNFTLQQPYWLPASHTCSAVLFPCLCSFRALCWERLPSSLSIYFLFTILQYLLQEGFPNLLPPKPGLGSCPSCSHTVLCLLLSRNLALYGSRSSSLKGKGSCIKKQSKTNSYIVTGISGALSKILLKG